MVFHEVNFPGDHDEGGQWVQGCVRIVSSTGTSNDARDSRVGERNGGMSVTVDGAFEQNRSKNEELPYTIP